MVQGVRGGDFESDDVPRGVYSVSSPTQVLWENNILIIAILESSLTLLMTNSIRGSIAARTYRKTITEIMYGVEFSKFVAESHVFNKSSTVAEKEFIFSLRIDIIVVCMQGVMHGPTIFICSCFNVYRSLQT